MAELNDDHDEAVTARSSSATTSSSPSVRKIMTKNNNSLVNLHAHKRFDTVSDYIQALGGKRSITKVLIANNGVAAVKAIRSIRRWAYEIFGDERAIQFVVMATPEDLRCVCDAMHFHGYRCVYVYMS